MSASQTGATEPIKIKKYANRRLYNTATSSYVTLEDLADMVKDGVDFTVADAKTGEDITRLVLTQIIFEQEGKGDFLLPVGFLRQLIGFYGNSLQTLVPSFLEVSLEQLAGEQEKLRGGITEMFGANPVATFEEQARRNLDLFTQSMSMFTPFGDASPDKDAKREQNAPQKTDPAAQDDVAALRQQLADMQAQLNKLAGGDAKAK
ncbi:MAG: polyhydroxyalkanoate synthesis repressor PhaR [Alphaproteobacteria bacterium]